jgi:hypothetical protein
MSGEPTFSILWPDRREVDGRTIRNWAADAVAAGILPAETDVRDAAACAQALHEAGLLTLAVEVTS